MRKADAS